jgi:hypothetical protein
MARKRREYAGCVGRGGLDKELEGRRRKTHERVRSGKERWGIRCKSLKL